MFRDYTVLPSVPWGTLGVIASGGMLGALGRFGLQSAFGAGGFPWPTFGINAAGSLLIGIVIVFASESRRAPRLTRPFLATGVLGGFTTFSTYVIDVQHEFGAGAPRTALLYCAATAVAALACAWAGIRLARAVKG